MKVAAAHDFHDEVAEAAAAICPGIEWALTDRAGTWTVPPEGSDVVIYAGDAYTEAFVDTAVSIAPPRWAHTEDAGIDGRFYDDMRAKGVAVTHSPGANAPEVAEFAFAGVMWGAKRLAEFRDQQRAHEWNQLKQAALGASTILVVGLGAIGSRVATYAGAFGMTVHGIRRSAAPVAGLDRQGTLDDLDDLLPHADFVVLAVPNTGETAGMIGADALALMKPTATLVNVGRGALVDIGALRDALGSGGIAQAFVDVLPTEPWPADSDLWDIPNLFISPHAACMTPLYTVRVGEIWLENLKRFLAGDALIHRAF